MNAASEFPGLARRASRVTLAIVAVQAAVLFAAAGTFDYAQAWLHLAMQMLTMAATNAYLFQRDPALLERRLTIEQTGEREPVQRRVIAAMRVAMIVMLAIAKLDRRFGAATTSPVVIASGLALVIVGAWVIVRVFRENTFTSSIVEVADGQSVICTGPYSLVRHPMYVGVLIGGAGVPLLLGSWHAALVLVPTIALLVIRVRAEERFLAEHLPGYGEYLSRTRWRLAPALW